METIYDLQSAQVMADALIEAADSEKQEASLYKYNGVMFPETSTVKKETLDSLPDWSARKDDVFVVTYPRAGTTWTQEITYLAMNGGNVEKAQTGHTFYRVPYLEESFVTPKLKWVSRPIQSLIVVWCQIKIMVRKFLFSLSQGRFSIPSTMGLIEMMPSPRLLKSHLPEHLLPPQVFEKKAKIIYVARNPKDLAVSFYHFHSWTYSLSTYDSWDQFFDDFIEGKVVYGKWWDHCLEYWRRRHDSNILFLKYEDMKKDEKSAVRKICEFLGYHYSDAILERIIQHTTFKSMKTNPMTNPDFLRGTQRDKGVTFMRKAIVGDWKNYFTDEQNEKIQELCDEKFHGTGLDFDYQ